MKSIVTLDMIREWAAFYNVSLEDGSQMPGVVGSLETLAEGAGTLPAELMNGNETFLPLMQAYWTKSGHEGDMPEDWKKPLVQVEDSKLPETPNT